MNKATKVIDNLTNGDMIDSKKPMHLVHPVILAPKKAKLPMPIKLPKMEMGIKSKLLDMPTKGGKKM